MRLADVSGFYAEAGGGVRRYVDAKFVAAAAAGIDLTVIAPGPADRTSPRAGGRVVWIEAPRMPFDHRYHRFTRAAPARAVLDAIAPDLVEASSPWGSATIVGGWRGEAARALVLHQDVVAAYGHTFLDRFVPRPAIDVLAAPWWVRLRRLSRQFDVTVAGGEWLARRLEAQGLVRTCASPFGVGAGVFSPRLRDEALRARLLARCGLGSDGRLAVAVSRFHPEKRLPVVIDAFDRAAAQRGDLGLIVVGDGLARRSVERAALHARRVVLLGAIEDRKHLAALLASADLFVHGSAAETYGLATAEAIASGLPVVVPDAGGAADLALRGRSRLYRVGSRAAAASAILDAADGELDAPRAPPPASLDAHFRDLFALYRRIADQRCRRAGGGLRRAR